MIANGTSFTIMSGGQSGVDRAGLDAAIAQDVPHGGWCPAGRRAEDGPIPSRYRLTETPSAAYEQRTEWNVRDADATLLLRRSGTPTGGTAFTRDCAIRLGKPYMQADPSVAEHQLAVQEWVRALRICSLNVAGPRESGSPGIYDQALHFLETLLRSLSGTRAGH